MYIIFGWPGSSIGAALTVTGCITRSWGPTASNPFSSGGGSAGDGGGGGAGGAGTESPPQTVQEVVVTARKASHNYSLTDQISPPGCYPSAAALQGLTASFAIPGQNPNSPVRNGQISNARVGPFSGPIVTYINGNTSVNVTLPGHIFYYGSVTGLLQLVRMERYMYTLMGWVRTRLIL